MTQDPETMLVVVAQQQADLRGDSRRQPKRRARSQALAWLRRGRS